MKKFGLAALATILACQASETGESPAPGAKVLSEEARLTMAQELGLSAEELAATLALSPLPPVPDDPTNAVFADPQAAELGQRLFYEPKLSKDGDTSCSTCHDPAKSWNDGKDLAHGVDRLDRHTMSLWNVAYNRWFFWDGRADSLWAQALGPLEHPLEHASSRLQIAHAVFRDAELRRSYERVFGPLPELADEERFPPVGRPVSEREIAWIEELVARKRDPDSIAPEHQHRAGTHFVHPHQRAWDSMTEVDQDTVTRVFVNLGKAIAAFERRITSSSAPFDTFVEGLRSGDPNKVAALSPAARRGLALFVGRGNCTVCHQGPMFTDREFHDLGLPATEAVTERDFGRSDGLARVLENPFNGAGRWSDDPEITGRERVGFLPKHGHTLGAEFKTPTLRNVAVTAPYMHHGQFPTLRSVLEHYSTLSGATPSVERVLVPLHLSEAETTDLIAFLESLTDTDLDPSLARPPSSP